MSRSACRPQSTSLAVFVLLVASLIACGAADVGEPSAAPHGSRALLVPGPTTTTSAPSPTTTREAPPTEYRSSRCPAFDAFVRMMAAMATLSAPDSQSQRSDEWRAARDAVGVLLANSESPAFTMWVGAAEADARDARIAAAANDPSQLVARARRLDAPEVRAAGDRLEQALLSRCRNDGPPEAGKR